MTALQTTQLCEAISRLLVNEGHAAVAVASVGLLLLPISSEKATAPKTNPFMFLNK